MNYFVIIWSSFWSFKLDHHAGHYLFALCGISSRLCDRCHVAPFCSCGNGSRGSGSGNDFIGLVVFESSHSNLLGRLCYGSGSCFGSSGLSPGEMAHFQCRSSKPRPAGGGGPSDAQATCSKIVVNAETVLPIDLLDTLRRHLGGHPLWYPAHSWQNID